MFASNKELVTFCWFPSKAIIVLSHGVPPVCTSFIKEHQHFWLVAGHIHCKNSLKKNVEETVDWPDPTASCQISEMAHEKGYCVATNKKCN